MFNATGNVWGRGQCERAVAVIRKENPEFAVAWKLFQDTAVEALDNPGKWFQVTKYVSFGYATSAPFPRLSMQLASGRKIHYPLPEKAPITMIKTRLTVRTGEPESFKWTRVKGHLTEDQAAAVRGISGSYMTSFHSWELTFWGHVKGTKYGRVQTFGGDALQSATQGTGVDLLFHGILEAERQGYLSFFVVHDQGLAPANNGTLEGYLSALCTVPDWFKGFPLEADGAVAKSYSKS